MRTITVTRENLLNLDAGNNTFIFNFSAGGADLTGCEIALSSMYLYYSWFNISEAFGNNVFYITMDELYFRGDGTTALPNSPWRLGADGLGLKITIPDGQYEIADLNAFFQKWCIDNNFYLISPTSEYVYFLTLQVNPTRYKIQVNVFSFLEGGTGVPAGYTEPPDGFLGGVQARDDTGATVTFPTTGVTGATTDTATPLTVGFKFPQFFNRIVGFKATPLIPYTRLPQAPENGLSFPNGASSILSQIAPQVQPVPVAFLNCDAIDNEYTSPASFLYAIPAKSGIGDLLVVEPANYNYCRIKAGKYNQITFRITDDRFRELALQDPNIVITLVIRDLTDIHTDTGKSGIFETAHADTMQKFARHPHNTQHKGRETQATQAGKGFGNRSMFG